MSCPICGAATRFHNPYLMCDECKRFVGVRINGRIAPRAKHSDRAHPSTATRPTHGMLLPVAGRCGSVRLSLLLQLDG